MRKRWPSALERELTVPRALDRYSAARRGHLAYYQLTTRWLTPFFQSHIDALGLVRDVLMAPAAKLRFVRREMVRSMAGTKTGFFFGSMEDADAGVKTPKTRRL